MMRPTLAVIAKPSAQRELRADVCKGDVSLQLGLPVPVRTVYYGRPHSHIRPDMMRDT